MYSKREIDLNGLLVNGSMRGLCLVSQHLRRRILDGNISVPQVNLELCENGTFQDASLEDIVQPTSLDLTTGEDVFVLDLER